MAAVTGCGSDAATACKAWEEKVGDVCVLKDGACESSDDCQIGEKCNLNTHLCESNIPDTTDGDTDLVDSDENDIEEETEEVADGDVEETGDSDISDVEDGDIEEGIADGDDTDIDESTDSIDEDPEEDLNPANATVGLYYYNHMETMPLFKPGTQTFTVSSHDLTGGNDDANHTHLYRDDANDYVLMDVKQPGCIMRMWFANIVDTGNLKVYFDNQADPLYNMPIESYFSGYHAPFEPPLVSQAGNAYTSYVPLCFRQGARVTTTARPNYYQITYQTFDNADGVVTHTGTEDYSGVTAMMDDNLGMAPIGWTGESVLSDTKAIPPGETRNLIERAGGGVITAIKIDLSPSNREVLQNLWLKAYWEGQSEPAVNAPISHLFLSGYDEELIQSLPVGMSPSDMYYFYLPMPFWSRATIEVENLGAADVTLSYQIKYTQEAIDVNSGHFFATYNAQTPTVDGQDYVVLDVTGRGQYVGTFMALETAGVYNPAFLQGDERMFIDNLRSPNWSGTGADNYFNGNFNLMGGPYTQPLFGYPYEPEEPQGTYLRPGYRWHIGDFVPFGSRFRMTLEHGGTNNIPTNFSSVAFYYRSCLNGLVGSDTFNVGSISAEQEHSFSIVGDQDFDGHQNICGCFEGPQNCVRDNVNATCEGDYATFSGRGIKSDTPRTGSMSFNMGIDPNNAGARLTRVLDYRVGNQDADVYVNGTFVGTWYTPGRNTYRFWLENGIDIPASITAGISAVTVTINYTGGEEWNAYEFKSWSYLPLDGSSPGPGKPRNLRKVEQVGLSVTIAWDEPNSGTSPVYYHVYRSETANMPIGDLSYIERVTETTFTDDNGGLGLTPQHHYYYKVLAEDCTGVRGEPSDELDLETGLPPVPFEAEDIFDDANTIPSNQAQIVDDANASGGKVVCFNGSQPGVHRLALMANLANAGTYVVKGVFLKGPDMGTYQTLISGQAVGAALDFYDATSALSGEITIGTRNISTAGDIMVLFIQQQPNASATASRICVDKLIFE